MPIDRDKALTAEPSVREIHWTTRDVLLYHLSLGATAPHLTYEKHLGVLPAFALVAGTGISSGEAAPPSFHLPGIDIDLRSVLHAGQGLRVHRPLPASGTATLASRVAEVRDKGKAALIVLESTASDAGGAPLWTSTMRIWARGEGGFGGGPGPEEDWTAPDRPADTVLTSATTPQQALWYRLNGDLNPLHADPEFARAAGFDRPILHGLASYGLLCEALVTGLLDGDVRRLTGLAVRFAGPVVPGETLETSVWHDGVTEDGERLLKLHTGCPERDGAPVLTHATATVTA